MTVPTVSRAVYRGGAHKAERVRIPLLCRLGLHWFRSPGYEPFYGAFYESHCLRRCGTPYAAGQAA